MGLSYYVMRMCMFVNIYQTRFEANSDLYGARKHFQNVAMQFYVELNSLEYMKQCVLLQSMLSFMHSQVWVVYANIFSKWYAIGLIYHSWLTLKWDMKF